MFSTNGLVTQYGIGRCGTQVYWVLWESQCLRTKVLRMYLSSVSPLVVWFAEVNIRSVNQEEGLHR